MGNIYAAALDNIFNAMKGLRIFERFEFNLPTETMIQRTSATLVNGYEEWIFYRKCFG